MLDALNDTHVVTEGSSLFLYLSSHKPPVAPLNLLMKGSSLFSNHAEYHTRILPKLFYAVVLRLNPEYLTRPQGFAKNHHRSSFSAILKEQQHNISKCPTTAFGATDRFITPPLIW